MKVLRQNTFVGTQVCWRGERRVAVKVGPTIVAEMNGLQLSNQQQHFGAEVIGDIKARVLESNGLPPLPNFSANDDIRQELTDFISNLPVQLPVQLPDLGSIEIPNLEIPTGNQIKSAVAPLLDGYNNANLTREANHALESLQSTFVEVQDKLVSATANGSLEPHWGSHLIAEIGHTAAETSLLYVNEMILRIASVISN